MAPVSALLVTLGRNSVDFDLSTSSSSSSGHFALQFPRDTRVKSAALLLIREKNSRYSLVRVSMPVRINMGRGCVRVVLVNAVIDHLFGQKRK